MVVSGIALTGASHYWSTISKREKEQELLFRGDQILRGIESYHKRPSAGSGNAYPGRLEDLLKDPRSLAVRRYVRKIYRDPMTEDGVWGLIVDQQGGIKGVFSKSKDKPLKVGDFPYGYEAFEKAEAYSDWKFVHNPEPAKKAPEK